MTTKKPAKKAKKSLAQARMKPYVAWQMLVPHTGSPLGFPQRTKRAAARMVMGRAAKVIVTELDASPDRRVEEIRNLCERRKAYSPACRDILRILNSKGPR